MMDHPNDVARELWKSIPAMIRAQVVHNTILEHLHFTGHVVLLSRITGEESCPVCLALRLMADELRAEGISMNIEIEFTRERLERLKESRKKAVNEAQDSFTFEGVLLDVGYAKYLIEYLESKLR